MAEDDLDVIRVELLTALRTGDVHARFEDFNAQVLPQTAEAGAVVAGAKLGVLRHCLLQQTDRTLNQTLGVGRVPAGGGGGGAHHRCSGRRVGGVGWTRDGGRAGDGVRQRRILGQRLRLLRLIASVRPSPLGAARGGAVVVVVVVVAAAVVVMVVVVAVLAR